jgi:hypothetical protein
MSVVLRSWSRSFATREKAREIATTVLESTGPRPIVDFEGVMVSPSFLAEFLHQLVENGRQPVLVGLDEDQSRTAVRLVKQLHLDGSVKIDSSLTVA